MQTVVEVLRKAEAYLAKAGLESPKVDAEWLLAGSLGLKRLELFLQHDRPLEEEQLAGLRERVRRRGAGEPLQYILGFEDFHGLRLKVGPGVLVPRPETEQLVELVLERISGVEVPRIIDLGTGSGAIALALAAARPDARVLAVDRSREALAIARANAEGCGLRERVAFRCGNWLEGIQSVADVIVANPPYLSEHEWQAARPEVRQHEPREALIAPDGGCADLLLILQQAGPRLAAGGLVALEMGPDHGRKLSAAAVEAGYVDPVVLRDFAQRERFFFARMGS